VSDQPWQIRKIDLRDGADAAALLELLDHYARDPMGGGEGLAEHARRQLVEALAEQAGYVGGLAWAGSEAVGLINCFVGFSTFAAQPLLNIHDIVVRNAWRRRGVGQALLAFAEAEAVRLGCCKLTLEVLSGNEGAMRAYRHAGFQPYELDPAAGQALFLQKKLSL